jgi:hypothetical protein
LIFHKSCSTTNETPCGISHHFLKQIPIPTKLVDALLEITFAIPYIDTLSDNERQQRKHGKEYQLVAAIVVDGAHDDELARGIEDGEVSKG